MGLVGQAPLSVVLTLGALFAGVAAPLYGLGAGQTNDHMGPDDFVAASGGLLFAWSIGASLGPTLAAGTMGLLGPYGLSVYLSVVLGGVVLFTIGRMRIRAGVPRDRQSGFVPAPSAPAGMAEFDPRSDAASD